MDGDSGKMRGMASATSRYHFLRNTTDIGAQLEQTWDATIPRVEKTFGNKLLKDLLKLKVASFPDWASRLAALRAGIGDPAFKVPASFRGSVYGNERWLLDALLHEAGKGPHPGTSMLELSFEVLPAQSRTLPPKSERGLCGRFVSSVLCDWAPDSPAGKRLAEVLQSSPYLWAEDVFESVVRSDYRDKRKGVWRVLGPTEMLAPFAAGTGKDECYSL